MKTVATLGSLALAGLATSATAALTEADTTYDIFTLYVQQTYGAVGEIAFDEDSLWLTQTFNKYLAESETKLAEGKEDYDFYGSRLSDFFEEAMAYSADYTYLYDTYTAKELTSVAYMAYSPEAYTDVIFDTAETVASGLKNATLSSWVSSERTSIEKDVADGKSPLVLTGKINEFVNLLMLNEDAGFAFVASFAELAVSTSAKYNIPTEEYGSGSGDDDGHD